MVQENAKLTLLRVGISSVASPICQEAQSEKSFPIVAFSSRFVLFFPDFSWFFSRFLANFHCQGWHSAPPCHPSGYATGGYDHFQIISFWQLRCLSLETSKIGTQFPEGRLPSGSCKGLRSLHVWVGFLLWLSLLYLWLFFNHFVLIRFSVLLFLF